LLNPFVSRVLCRICIRIVKLCLSACEVEILPLSGSPRTRLASIRIVGAEAKRAPRALPSPRGDCHRSSCPPPNQSCTQYPWRDWITPRQTDFCNTPTTERDRFTKTDTIATAFVGSLCVHPHRPSSFASPANTVQNPNLNPPKKSAQVADSCLDFAAWMHILMYI
jgi:hypothetical protein